MKQVIQQFIEELKNKDEVTGILIFGSYARGDQRDNSDVDIFAMVTEGVWRDVETRDGQTFELVYASKDKAKSFYKENANDAVQQWDDGIIVYDKNEDMKELQSFVYALRDKGKEILDEKQVQHMQFDREDKLSAINELKHTDLPTANLYLQKLGQDMLIAYFDLNREWMPAPKQILKYLRNKDSKVAELFDSFYISENIELRCRIMKNIITKVFKK